MSKTSCPNCGSAEIYQGLNDIECPTPSCGNYTVTQAKAFISKTVKEEGENSLFVFTSILSIDGLEVPLDRTSFGRKRRLPPISPEQIKRITDQMRKTLAKYPVATHTVFKPTPGGKALKFEPEIKIRVMKSNSVRIK